MPVNRLAWWLPGLLLMASVPSLSQEPGIPMLAKRMTDLSGTLSSSEVAALEGKLGAFEESTSTQIAVVMIPDLNGGSIEDASIRLAEKNFLGQKAKDNGVLLLIAKDDRQMRIEVGYGLEGVLTDALSGQIIRNDIAPQFRLGRFYEGIDAGVDAIMRATRNEYQEEGREGNEAEGINPLIIVLLVLLFWFLRAAGSGRRTLRRGMGPIFHGGGWGGSSRSGGFGGGFSGGGGSFGGGGASGRW